MIMIDVCQTRQEMGSSSFLFGYECLELPLNKSQAIHKQVEVGDRGLVTKKMCCWRNYATNIQIGTEYQPFHCKYKF